MNEKADFVWDDSELIEYIRKWAVEQSKCGRDGDAASQIDERHIFPAAKILKSRGAGSITKLLPLLQDTNADVRLAAASIAYEVDRRECRKVLEELAKTLDMAGIMALMTLSIKEGPAAVPDPHTFWR
jgi:Domain of unknown function (DUF2019)